MALLEAEEHTKASTDSQYCLFQGGRQLRLGGSSWCGPGPPGVAVPKATVLPDRQRSDCSPSRHECDPSARQYQALERRSDTRTQRCDAETHEDT